VPHPLYYMVAALFVAGSAVLGGLPWILPGTAVGMFVGLLLAPDPHASRFGKWPGCL
jgi:hypothetical protein